MCDFFDLLFLITNWPAVISGRWQAHRETTSRHRGICKTPTRLNGSRRRFENRSAGEMFGLRGLCISRVYNFMPRPFRATYLMSTHLKSFSISSMATKQKRIGTHNGSFHCDEALGCFMIRLSDKFRGAEIVRTRDPKVRHFVPKFCC